MARRVIELKQVPTIEIGTSRIEQVAADGDRDCDYCHCHINNGDKYYVHSLPSKLVGHRVDIDDLCSLECVNMGLEVNLDWKEGQLVNLDDTK